MHCYTLNLNLNFFWSCHNLDTQDSRYFELDKVSGSVTVKRAIPEDDLLQPVTMVIRVCIHSTLYCTHN